MVVSLRTSIAVGAVFRRGAVVPRWFLYRGRKIPVREITYTWTEREGSTVCLHFSVSDGVNLYELSFRPERLMWILEAVED
ncbi:MAG: hypothetical protein N3B18_12010 [Desulfobacterota bacterium]|nr:hypothetical protein [Thermodesulfobacteriota bacterium]